MSGKQPKLLAAPVLPDVVNGELKRSDLSRGKIIVPVYDFMSIGDKYTLYIIGEPVNPQIPIMFPDIRDVTAIAPIERPIDPGPHVDYWETLSVHYVISKKDGSSSQSQTVTATIV